MKTRYKMVFSGFLTCGFLLTGVLAGLSFQNKGMKKVDAATGHVDTSLSTYYANIATEPDSNYYKTMEEGTDYALGDGTIANIQVDHGLSNQVPQIRNRNNAGNYYIYLKYNSTHSAVGQLGASLIFNAKPGYLLDAVDLYNGYQVADAFQVEILNQSTGAYDVDVYDQMFSASNATYSHTFTKPTTSFKITHYLHSTSSHSLVAWKETRVSYETGYTLTFDSQGGTSVPSQTYPEVTTDVTVEPTAPSRAPVGTTKYTFDGWFTDAECTPGNEFVFGNVLTSNTTVYAKWLEEIVSGYTITFDTNGGSAVPSQVAQPGDTFVKPNDPSKDTDGKYNYTFVDWYSDEDLTEVYDFSTPAASDITVYAKYSYAQSTLVGSTSIGMKTNIMTYGETWSSDGKTYEEYDLQSSAISNSMVDSTFEFRRAISGNYGICRQGSGKYDVQIKKAIVTWQLNDYSKYIKSVRWDLRNTNYTYSTNYIVHLYAGRNGTGTLIDSDYMNLKDENMRCVQMLNNTDESVNAVSFKNDLANSFYYGFETIKYVLETASDAQQAKFFAQAFLREFTCDGLGSITSDTWQTFSDRTATMSSGALALLKAAAQDDPNLGEAVKRYDFVIGKYGTSGHADFLHRTEEGGGYQVNVVSPREVVTNNVQVVIVIAAITIITAASVATFFVRSKRKI